LPAGKTAPDKTTNETSEARTAMLSPAATDSQKTPANIFRDISTNDELKALPVKPKTKTKWLLFAVLSLIVLAVSGFFAYRYFTPVSKQIESIAVMPFENKSGNTDSEYLSDGLAESLIYRLSQLPNLKVSPTSSVFRYKGRETDVQIIGNELSVDTVMTGRIVQRGDNLTISVELVDVRNNRLLWGEQYERKLSELLQTQREIASEITGKLRLKLSGEGEQMLAKKYTDNPEAFQLYLKGRFYWNKRTNDGLKQSVEYYNQAIEKDPNFALAFGGLAQSYVLLGFFGAAPPKDLMPKAKASAERALELDDSLAEAHAALGIYLCNFAWNLEAGEKEFRRAIELDPNYATAYHWLGNSALIGLKRFDEAIAAGKKAEVLDPLSPVISADTGVNLYAAERFDEAIVQFDRALSLDPNFPFTHFTLGRIYDAQSKYAEAIREYRKALELDTDNPVTKAYLAASLAKSGNRRAALKILDELKAQASRGFVPPMAFATLYIGFGEKDAAFAWMENDFENRSFIPPYYPVIPAYKDIRGDPRFDELMRRVEAAKMD
jgi:TolB-like protein/Tfp pilus assembly protein PilF